ncbi:MAG: methionyl-tRNA formyltransferase [Acutalibacteraceae bacterium]|nr:methionyl-tRNA formyltransferase [Acutalibacteraceae bacterium]
MRVVFMGTPDFAVDCLDILVENGHDVVGVFSQPDKPQGRKQIMTPPAVKARALELGLDVYQPVSFKDGEAAELLEKLAPELIVVVAYGKLIPQRVLDIPKYGCINVHASLLPKLRGAAPIQWSVINGEKETGVTTMQLDAGLDTGDILLVKKTEIEPNETSGELFDRLKVLGAELLIETINAILDGTLNPIKQDDSQATYASMLDKKLSPVDWTKTAQQVHDHIRGLEPWPVATTVINEKIVKLYGSRLAGTYNKQAGEVVKADNELIVCCGDGNAVSITQIQAQGKNKLNAADFLRGFKIEKGTIL